MTPKKEVKNMFFKRDSQDLKTLNKDSNPFKKIEHRMNSIVEVPEIEPKKTDFFKAGLSTTAVVKVEKKSKKRKAKEISDERAAT